MEIIQGKKSIFLDKEGFKKIIAPYHQVVVDLGTGDGKFVYNLAKKQPDTFFIGLDADRSNLVVYSAKTAKKPQRGGVSNLLYVIANAENLPAELCGTADTVWIVLPWGSLLQGIAQGQANLLSNIVKISAPGAELKAIITYEIEYEAAEIEKLGLPELSLAYVDKVLAPRFWQQGLSLMERKFLTNQELKAVTSTWAKRLGYGKVRNTLFIQASITPQARSGGAHEYPGQGF